MRNGLGYQRNRERGIYPERPFFYAKIGMILIGSKRIQEDPGLFSLPLTGEDTGSLCLWEREAGWLWITEVET